MVSAPDGSQVLESTLAGSAPQARARHDIGTGTPVVYVTGWLFVDSSTSTTDYTTERIFAVSGVVSNVALDLRYTPSRGFYLRFRRYDNGAGVIGDLDGATNDNLQLSADTWYRFGFKYDSATGEYEGRLWDDAGALLDSASGVGTLRSDSQYVDVGPAGSKTGATRLYWDAVLIDEARWP